MTWQATDDRGRTLDLAGPVRRIVSLVPCVTELLGTLGAAERLVGVTRYCSHPRAVVRECQRVGGTKDPDCGKILALRPDVVLVSPEENRREDFERLHSAGARLFVLAPSSIESLLGTVKRLGALLGVAGRAAELAREIAAAHGAVVGGVRGRVSVFCPIWREPWMSFNRHTYAGDALRCAGGDNVCAGAEECYPRVDLADIAARAPEVILLPDEPYRFTPDDIAALQPLSDSPAWRNGRVHLVDGRDLFWYGTRTAAALNALQKTLATS